MAFWVSIGFCNERSGAALLLLRGESPYQVRCWWCLVAVWLGHVSAGFGYVSAGAVDRVKGGRGGVQGEAFAVHALFPYDLTHEHQ
jgi:hypothetical protein